MTNTTTFSSLQGWTALSEDFPELAQIPPSWAYLNNSVQIMLCRRDNKDSVFILCDWDQVQSLFLSFSQTLSQTLQAKLAAWSKVYWNVTALSENLWDFVVVDQNLIAEWPPTLWTAEGHSPLRAQVQWDSQLDKEISWSSSLASDQEEILYNYNSLGQLISSDPVRWFEGTGLIWDLELSDWQDHEFVCWQDNLGDWLALAPIKDRGQAQVENSSPPDTV